MATTEHAEMMRILRARKKELGLKEFRADVLPHEMEILKRTLDGMKLQRRLNGMPEELWK